MCLKSLAATSKVVSYSVQAYIGIICLRCVSITLVLMGGHPPDAITLSATDGSIDYFLFSSSVLISKIAEALCHFQIVHCSNTGACGRELKKVFLNKNSSQVTFN